MENQNKLPLKQEFRIPYSDRVGEDRDKEILERYKIIVDYYIENPHRIPDNLEKLENPRYFDAVLVKDESLAKKLHKILKDSSNKGHTFQDLRAGNINISIKL